MIKPFVPNSASVKNYYAALSVDREMTRFERAVFSVLLATRDQIHKT